jgi:hypothetical protein
MLINNYRYLYQLVPFSKIINFINSLSPGHSAYSTLYSSGVLISWWLVYVSASCGLLPLPPVWGQKNKSHSS